MRPSNTERAHEEEELVWCEESDFSGVVFLTLCSRSLEKFKGQCHVWSHQDEEISLRWRLSAAEDGGLSVEHVEEGTCCWCVTHAIM